MSRLPAGQLNVRKIEGLEDGVHGDGGNLYLTIKEQARHWTVLYFSPTTNKRREIEIGSYFGQGTSTGNRYTQASGREY